MSPRESRLFLRAACGAGAGTARAKVPCMTNLKSTIQELANKILTERLNNMPTAELLRVAYGDAVELPDAPAPTPRPALGLREALVRVLRDAERPLTSNDIVARVQALRPNSPDPSIRSEITRARHMGIAKLTGEPRGGTYTVARSTMRPRARAAGE
jgi:hypothetical protein